MANLRDQMRQMETDTEEITAKLQKDLSAVNKLEELFGLPSKLKDLEIKVLRNQNLNSENDQMTQKVNSRLVNLETMFGKANKVNDMLSSNKNLNAQEIIQSVMSITQEVQASMIHRDEFNDLRAETGSLLSTVNELNIWKKDATQKMTDDHYSIIQNVHSCQELKITQTEQQLELKKALDRQKHLIDAELFEEEINNLQALVLSTNKASGQKSSDKTVGVPGSGPP